MRKLYLNCSGNDEKEAALNKNIPDKGTSKFDQHGQCRVSEEVTSGRGDQSGSQGPHHVGSYGLSKGIGFTLAAVGCVVYKRQD